MTTDSTYVRFVELEEQVAHIYFLFQQRFVDDHRLAKLWTEAALEEMQHASILRFCAEHRLFSPSQIHFKDADQVGDMLATVKATVNVPDLTVDQAFYAALLIESSGIDKLFRQLIRGLASSHPLLYSAIETSLRTHHLAFAQAAQAFVSDRFLISSFRDLIDREQF